MIDCGLSERDLEAIKLVFHAHSKIDSVKIFGSRAKGNHRKNSDIDLAIIGNIDSFEMEVVSSELEDLPLPYKFDAKALNQIISTELLEHINRIGVTIYDSKK